MNPFCWPMLSWHTLCWHTSCWHMLGLSRPSAAWRAGCQRAQNSSRSLKDFKVLNTDALRPGWSWESSPQCCILCTAAQEE